MGRVFAASMSLRSVAVTETRQARVVSKTTPYREPCVGTSKPQSIAMRFALPVALLLFGDDACSRWRWYRRSVGGRWAKTDYAFSPQDNIFLTVPHCYCKSSCECGIYDLNTSA